MRKFSFKKLVRDNILKMIEQESNIASYHVLSEVDYVAHLKQKLLEEAQELLLAGQDQTLEELADVQEIIDCLLVALNFSKDDLVNTQKKKNKIKGSFLQRIYIDHVEVGDDYQGIEYYLANADRYPEIK